MSKALQATRSLSGVAAFDATRAGSGTIDMRVLRFIVKLLLVLIVAALVGFALELIIESQYLQ